MSVSENYRQNAARERELAGKTQLLNRRDMHERSAMIWEEMATNAENIAGLALANAAAKAGSS